MTSTDVGLGFVGDDVVCDDTGPDSDSELLTGRARECASEGNAGLTFGRLHGRAGAAREIV